MYARTAIIKASSRRGTVMVLVVGVLAMLFIIGSTLLIVGRFERQTVMAGATAKNMEAVSQGAVEPIIVLLRSDLRGANGKVYLREWEINPPPLFIDDYGDYAGVMVDAANVPVPNLRNGDLFLSALEPYEAGAGGWNLFAASWFRDAIKPNPPTSLPPGTIAVGLVGSDPDWGGIVADADGDGIRDAVKLLNVGFSDSFGGTFSMGLRVIPHSGMVWLNRMTHPTLLAQVIHPRDIRQGANKAEDIKLIDLDGLNVHGTDGLRYELYDLVLSPTDENRLRRRFMLAPLLPTPDPNQTYRDVASALVRLLPITTGYAEPNDPTGWERAPKNQWLMFQQGQESVWENRISPGSAMTDGKGNYAANNDRYDRRHLITTESSDDALRPQRDERRLQAFPLVAPFTGHFENIISPVNASLSLAYGVMDYTASGGTLDHVFNTDGLRTQFSLRDVLEPVWVTDHWEGQASYRRAMQLTAYFLAMIQHTTAGGADPSAQLRTAMQLAVNAIDFADADQIPTYFEFDNGAGLAAKVVGVEKQPYITEAYVKVVHKPKPKNPGPGFLWPTEGDDEWACEESIYAVELYNPYDVPLPLAGYELKDARKDVNGNVLGSLDLGTDVAPSLPEIQALSLESGNWPLVYVPAGAIPPHSYLVISSRLDDPAADPGTGAPPFPADGQSANVPGRNVVSVADLRIEEDEPIVLVRKGWNKLDSFAPPTNPPVFDSLASVEVDVLRSGWLNSYWAKGPAVATATPPAGGGDRLVRDSSLQRHKESNRRPPCYWHFTLSRQIPLPLRLEVPVNNGGTWMMEEADVGMDASGTSALVDVPEEQVDGVIRPYQHNLLKGSNSTILGNWIASESAGVEVWITVPDPDNVSGMGNNYPQRLLDAAKLPIAPFPVMVADRGVHPSTGGTMAFPATGTLLLVTRYAHLPIPEDKPVSVAVTEALTQTMHGFGRNALATTNDPTDPGQLQMIDNGHMPVFYVPGLPSQPVDPSKVERCVDGNNSRFNDLPWGQLVFEYFTALPMEELARDLYPGTLGVQNLMAYASVPEDYLREYLAYDGQYNDPGHPEYVRFANYPVMMPVSQASSPLGPRVQGRIGIGNAPWWVLDGLPVLPDAVLGTKNTIPENSIISLAGLPVPEIEARRLDPAGTAWNSMAGAWFVHGLIDEKYLNLNNAPLPYYDPVVPSQGSLPEIPPAGMPSISPRLAQYMVSYREQRPVGAVEAVYADRIGFATAGEICNVLAKVQLGNLYHPITNTLINESHPLHEWRLWADSNNVRPFSYLGYLQLVTPIVRMQDWMTVKNHVFTIYATIQSSGQPPVTVRTQVTVDRTRCLYNPSDLPERITETPPISYYNAVDD